MPDIAHFMIPADNVDRAKHFYHNLPGWKIGPTSNPMDPSKMEAMQYHDISTGAAKEGTLSTGGLWTALADAGVQAADLKKIAHENFLRLL